MPTYVYRREDGTTFEIEQPITASALETCPTTGQPVRRLISGNAGLIFKGDGFYLTDYARKGKGGEKAEGGSGKSDAKQADTSASDTATPKAAEASGTGTDAAKS